LRCREPVDVLEHRGAQLVQSAVRELHLRLDADRGHDVPAGTTLRDEVEQGALADAGVAPKDDDAAPTVDRVGQNRVEELALGTASKKVRNPPPPGARHGPYPTPNRRRGA
jgi:hypothetical protein